MAGEGRARDAAPGDAATRRFGGRYRVVAAIRSGRLTAVWRAWDETRLRHVAVKTTACPSVDPEDDDPVRREAAVLGELRHAGVVPLLDAGVDGDVPYLVMPYLGGGTLEHRRPRRDDGLTLPGDVTELWHWLPAVAAALDFVHGRGFVHGDVKAANVIYDGTGAPFLADFGSARRASGADDVARDLAALAETVRQWLVGAEHPGAVAGTPSPPAAAGAAADLVTRRPDLPELVVTAVSRGLLTHAAGRFANCAAFADALLAATHRPTSVEKIQLLCPRCDRLLNVDPSTAGRRGRCPRCRTGIVVAADLQSLETASERAAVGPAARTWRPGGQLSWSSLGRFAILGVAILALVALTRRHHGTPAPEENAARVEPVSPPVAAGAVDAGALDAGALDAGAGHVDLPDARAADAHPANAGVPDADVVDNTPPPPGPAVGDPRLAATVAAPAAAASPADVPEPDGAVRTPPASQDPPAADPPPAPRVPHAPVARLPVPSDDDIARATSAVRSALATEYRRAGERGQSLRLTETLQHVVVDSPDASRRYAALLEVERLCVEDGRIQDAVDAVRKRCSLFACDAESGRRSVLDRARESRHLPTPGMCRQALALAERFLGEEDFASAGVALALARQAASTPDIDGFANCREMVADLDRAIAERHRAFHEFAAARDAVVADPANAAAAETVGTYLCLTRHDWETGLPHLAASDLPAVADIARRHLRVMQQNPPDPDAVVAVADDWWRIAEGAVTVPWSDAEKAAVRRFASSLYASVVDELDEPFERRLAAERAGRTGE